MLFERRFRFVDAADFRPTWALPQQTGELRKLLSFTRSVNFHAAVIQVAHPAGQAQRVCRAFYEIAEADALHLPPYAIEPG